MDTFFLPASCSRSLERLQVCTATSENGPETHRLLVQSNRSASPGNPDTKSILSRSNIFRFELLAQLQFDFVHPMLAVAEY